MAARAAIRSAVVPMAPKIPPDMVTVLAAGAVSSATSDEQASVTSRHS